MSDTSTHREAAESGLPGTPCSALVDKLIAMRTLAIAAQKLAIDGSEDGKLYPVIVALDPVVDGIHEALKILGLGFMEYRQR